MSIFVYCWNIRNRASAGVHSDATKFLHPYGVRIQGVWSGGLRKFASADSGETATTDRLPSSNPCGVTRVSAPSRQRSSYAVITRTIRKSAGLPCRRPVSIPVPSDDLRFTIYRASARSRMSAKARHRDDLRDEGAAR